MIRTFGIGLRTSQKAFLAVWSGTLRPKTSVNPKGSVKTNSASETIAVFRTLLGVHGRPYRVKNGVRVVTISPMFLSFFVFAPFCCSKIV